MPRVQWIGGAQDGAYVDVPEDVTWVAVLEDRRNPGYTPMVGEPTMRSLQRYSVPIINGKIVWAQRVEASPEPGEI